MPGIQVSLIGKFYANNVKIDPEFNKEVNKLIAKVTGEEITRYI